VLVALVKQAAIKPTILETVVEAAELLPMVDQLVATVARELS
jgi:hypothetical protein